MNLFLSNKRRFCLTFSHSYIKDDVYIANFGDIDAIRAAVYCQFMYEIHCDIAGILSNVEIAALLCMFYGFYGCGQEEKCTIIDMYAEREKFVGRCDELINDTFMYRELFIPVLKQIHIGQSLCYEQCAKEKARLTGARPPLAATT